MPEDILHIYQLRPEEAEVIDQWRAARKMINEGFPLIGAVKLNACKKIIGYAETYLTPSTITP